MQLELAGTGPLSPHAHNRLVFFTLFCWLESLQTPSLSFPWVLFGLAVLIQALGAAGLGWGIEVICAHTSLWNRIIHAGVRQVECMYT